MNEKTIVPIPPDKQLAKRFRLGGIAILVVGVIAAILVYWKGTPSEDYSNQLAMQQMIKTNGQAEQRMFGKTGTSVVHWAEAMKEPGPMAIIIVLASGIVAWGCFYFAQMADDIPSAARKKSSDQSRSIGH